MAAQNSLGPEIYPELVCRILGENLYGFEQPKNVRRDIETVKSRYVAEGVSFLTKTLPSLGKAVDLSLETGRFSIPRGFKPSHGNRNVPAFMQGHFNRVFDESGYLRPDASPEAIAGIRQVAFLCYKVDLPYSKVQEAAVVAAFEETEVELSLADEIADDAFMAHVNLLVDVVLKGFDPKDIKPKHGPGAVATGEKLEEKWLFSRLFNKIHQKYPYYEYFIVGGARELSDRLRWYKNLERCQDGTAKVILVPKDSRGPRLISSEPLEFQWAQQGLGRKLKEHLESNRLTKGQVNFTLQTINQELALSSSLTREFATLDLKDASDRVSLNLVKRIFQNHEILPYLEATRSGSTLLPNGKVLELKKFAPMGSALCFPVEAFVFWLLSVVGIARATHLSTQRVAKMVFVYGDDIIVPTQYATLCMDVLERYGLKVNRAKSFVNGSFRESCGVDAFKGVIVTPLRLKSRYSGNPTDGQALASYVSIANRLEARGYVQCSQFLWEQLRLTYGFIPYGTDHSGYPCRIVSDPEQAERLNHANGLRTRWNERYHRFEFWVKRLSTRKISSRLDGWLRLLRDIVAPPTEDPSEVVVPRSTKIKRGWSPV